jgi:hypothetical protein
MIGYGSRIKLDVECWESYQLLHKSKLVNTLTLVYSAGIPWLWFAQLWILIWNKYLRDMYYGVLLSCTKSRLLPQHVHRNGKPATQHVIATAKIYQRHLARQVCVLETGDNKTNAATSSVFVATNCAPGYWTPSRVTECVCVYFWIRI